MCTSASFSSSQAEISLRDLSHRGRGRHHHASLSWQCLQHPRCRGQHPAGGAGCRRARRLFDIRLRRLQFLLFGGREGGRPRALAAHDQFGPAAIQCCWPTSRLRMSSRSFLSWDAVGRCCRPSHRGAGQGSIVTDKRRESQRRHARGYHRIWRRERGNLSSRTRATRAHRMQRIVPSFAFKHGVRIDTTGAMPG